MHHGHEPQQGPVRHEPHQTAPGATTHVIRFAGSTVTAVSSGVHLKSTKQGDEWSITIDDHEHYVIPDAVIMGG